MEVEAIHRPRDGSDVEVDIFVDGSRLPLNKFSNLLIAKVVTTLVSSYRGAEKYRDGLPERLEIRLGKRA